MFSGQTFQAYVFLYILLCIFNIFYIYNCIFIFTQRFCVSKRKIDTIKLKHRVETKTSLLECFSMLTANPITCGYASCLIVTKTHTVHYKHGET